MYIGEQGKVARADKVAIDCYFTRYCRGQVANISTTVVQREAFSVVIASEPVATLFSRVT